uniref:Uncharacterized protein n=1 Tax=Rhizophora mucronata TaxID=61149 RepID=A0A2P2PU60_RHIMU
MLFITFIWGFKSSGSFLSALHDHHYMIISYLISQLLMQAW